MGDIDTFLENVRRARPDLAIDRAELNQEGMVNDIVVVNGDMVFRFPKSEWGKRSQAREAALLQEIQPHLTAPIPELVMHGPDMASYRMIAGVPMTREVLFRLSPDNQAGILAELGRFLHELHTFPAGNLSGIDPSDATRTRLDWIAMYERLEEVLFPLLFKHQREYVRDLFTPVVSGQLDMEVEPVLIHGDLAPYHILIGHDSPAIAGIIDFGTAGLGDPAIDIATLLAHYGERIVNRLAPAYHLLPDIMARAVFRASALELEWALIGVRENDPSMLVAHIGTARDYPPLL